MIVGNQHADLRLSTLRPAQRNAGRDDGPVPGLGFELHRAAEQRGTFSHALETEAVMILIRL
ncbi:MAG TPA: hypothetical protein VJ816_04315, partial [Gemmatimonadales bacterium]|nr:hypothetical protein [Gemmatimonadales bacterium]